MSTDSIGIKRLQAKQIIEYYQQKEKELSNQTGAYVSFLEKMINDVRALNIPPDPYCSNARKSGRHRASSTSGASGICGFCYCSAEWFFFGDPDYKE